MSSYKAAAAVSHLGTAMCLLQGIKNPQTSWFNPYEEILFQQTAKQTVDSAAAKTFLQLAQEQILPSWVGIYVDIDLIRAAAQT
ncbi:MAG TPA: hypothetical protein VK203_11840 [Nostocaceae cyanobacterium]|nr:hypothetical protein [Nostocaceae cyanobacterium]